MKRKVAAEASISSSPNGHHHAASPSVELVTQAQHSTQLAKRKFATTCVHVGSEPDPNTGAVVPPISLATTFAQKSLGEFNGIHDINSYGIGYEYSRTANPTRGNFERAIAAVEQGKYGLAFASGLAATASIIQTLKAGEHVISIDDVYGGTQRMFHQIAAPGSNITFTLVDLSNPELTLRQVITDKTRLIWLESPTNPTLKISDIAAVARVIQSLKREDIWLVVDNTFMSPYFQNPLLLGADIVLHSVTKYIGGHSDVLMGAVVTNRDDIHSRLRFLQNSMGAVPSPFDCYLALRGLKTLHLRMEASQRNAFLIAHYLESQIVTTSGSDNNGESKKTAAVAGYVEKVTYPGLTSHPQHEIATRQASGYGAMISFAITGGITEATVFLNSLKLFTLAESLGAVESLAESPAIMTHASVPLAQRKLLGISDNLIRLSVGVEDGQDLIEDLQQALEKAAADAGGSSSVSYNGNVTSAATNGHSNGSHLVATTNKKKTTTTKK